MSTQRTARNRPFRDLWGRTLRWLSLGLAIVLAVGLLTPVSSSFAEGVSGEVLVGPRSTNANGDGIRTPDIVAISASEAVTVWREGTTVGTHDSGSLMYSYTTDGGATWSTPAYLKQRDANYSWHWVILYKFGTDIYAFVGRTTAASTNGNPATPMMMKSTDGGHNWADYTTNFAGTPANFVVAGRPLLDGTTHIVPVWYTDGAGKLQSTVIRSTDLATWTKGADVPWTATADGGISPGEPMIALSQSTPGTLVIVARVSRSDAFYAANATSAYVATSVNGGANWTEFAPEPNIPNYNTKTYFTKSSNGSYLAIYNTFGGTFNGPASGRPDEYRGTLYYSVKKPGQDWSAGRFFADGPPVLTARDSSDGWDTYPMADEYEPGKFFVVWEHDTSVIKFAKLDITDAFTNMDQNWTNLAPYSSTLNGGSVTMSVPSGSVILSNDDSTDTSVVQAEAPGTGFIASFSGKLTDTAILNTTTGVGVNMGLEVRNGARGLMMTVQSDGVYAKVSGSATWQKVLNQAIDSAYHQYRVVVNSAGVARLFMDSLDTSAQWTIPTDAGSKRARVWVSGSAADTAAAQVDWTLVEENVVSSVFDDLSGWSTFTSGGTVASTSGQLTMTSTGVGLNGAGQNPAKFCAYTVDLRGAVTNYAPLNTTTGEGSNLAIKVQNGAFRLMLTIQTDGVYVLARGSTTWTRVYTLASAGALASWRIDTNSAGQAHLYRNGSDTGAAWVLQPLDDAAAVTMWTSGRSGDASAAEVDWLRTTCNGRVPASTI